MKVFGIGTASLIVLAAGVLCWFSAGGCIRTKPPELTDAQQQELKTYVDQLSDRTRSTRTRQEAAELLLTRSYPQAAEALKNFLVDETNRPAQIAVAEAIAIRGSGRKEFVKPLLAMLTGKAAAVRAPAARALATYTDGGVIDALIGIAKDRRREQEIRLVTITAFRRILDRKVIGSLIGLLRDPETDVRHAAAVALADLTNIRTFGADADKWRSWWWRNRFKPRSEWLADLTASLFRSNRQLENENALLRERLSRSMQELYAATPVAQREALLLRLLKDPLGNVRLAGTTIVNGIVAANQKVSEPVRVQVRTMLGDEDPRLRREAALLVANLGDSLPLDTLLKRLQVERVGAVRIALLTALGQVGVPKVISAVVAEIGSREEGVATAAAGALERLAARQPLDDDLREKAVKALLGRYRLTGRQDNGVALRESLLNAMAVMGDEACAAAFVAALKDPAATVRLAGVNGLAKLGKADHADAVAGMLDDKDLGVRKAAVSALGELAGLKYLDRILIRTNPGVEGDAAARKHAWGVAMSVLEKADSKTLQRVCDSLTDRAGARDRRLEVMRMLTRLGPASGGQARRSGRAARRGGVGSPGTKESRCCGGLAGVDRRAAAG